MQNQPFRTGARYGLHTSPDNDPRSIASKSMPKSHRNHTWTLAHISSILQLSGKEPDDNTNRITNSYLTTREDILIMKLRTVMTAALFVALVGPGLAHASPGGGAEGGAGFADTVGTHIYSPGPMTPSQPFELEMAMSAPAMAAIHADMMSHPSTPGTETIACTMSAVPHHRGMVMLKCTPGT